MKFEGLTPNTTSYTAVVKELTKNGGNITDWNKFRTKSVELSSGQKVQVHFYKNIKTWEVNYNIDFKVKGEVK